MKKIDDACRMSSSLGGHLSKCNMLRVALIIKKCNNNGSLI